jgi:hypothetical protein
MSKTTNSLKLHIKKEDIQLLQAIYPLSSKMNTKQKKLKKQEGISKIEQGFLYSNDNKKGFLNYLQATKDKKCK